MIRKQRELEWGKKKKQQVNTGWKSWVLSSCNGTVNKGNGSGNGNGGIDLI